MLAEEVKTICVKCKWIKQHSLFSRCLNPEVRHPLERDPVSGDETRRTTWCADVNNGNCSYFEEKPVVEKKSLWQRLFDRGILPTGRDYDQI